MSKLPRSHKFLDFSDYGRKPGTFIAKILQQTPLTPIHVTTLFVISGLIAIVCILNNQMYFAASFVILKSILDAADGTLARLKKTSSYTGRYYDSISDIILNFLILFTIYHITQGNIIYMLFAFIGIQLQGTVYNYYYVILRNRVNGDSTSRVIEKHPPKAMEGEEQKIVNRIFWLYYILYGIFDKTIYWMDKKAVNCRPFPKWFMSLISIFGLGFQLLIIALMLVLNLTEYIIPFFITYSTFIFVFIGIRKLLLK